MLIAVTSELVAAISDDKPLEMFVIVSDVPIVPNTVSMLNTSEAVAEISATKAPDTKASTDAPTEIAVSIDPNAVVNAPPSRVSKLST